MNSLCPEPMIAPLQPFGSKEVTSLESLAFARPVTKYVKQGQPKGLTFVLESKPKFKGPKVPTAGAYKSIKTCIFAFLPLARYERNIESPGPA
jgi:hypothetical protein